jgi:hypothetical protein
MKVIAMVPSRNEAWVIEHALACLSAFCDVILVSDRRSEDDTRARCARFPKVVLLEPAPESRIREQRWQLLDAARAYDGCNLLWATDADELVSPVAASAWLARERDRLRPGTAIECRYYHLWHDAGRYRDDASHYAPQWKPVAFVDDRRSDFDRANAVALHEPRVPAGADAPVVQAAGVAVLHLQWLIPQRNQLKQAWYRGREWLDGHGSAASINEFYAVTLPAPGAALAPVPADWIAGLTFPPAAADGDTSWHLQDLLAWFDQHGIEHFEPLEIWHIGVLRDEFRRRLGRSPKPDRSYRPSWPLRARRLGTRLVNAARRRLPI